MKRAISFILAVMMCLSLCACGGGGSKTSELVLDETCSISAYDITVTGFDFTEKATFPDGGGYNLQPRAGYVTANLYFDVKYNGKTTTFSSNFSPDVIDYNDGFEFELEEFYFYDSGIHAWLNMGEIEPLTPKFSCKASFFVPLEVKENTSAPLFVKFVIDNIEVIYKVR